MPTGKSNEIPPRLVLDLLRSRPHQAAARTACLAVIAPRGELSGRLVIVVSLSTSCGRCRSRRMMIRESPPQARRYLPRSSALIRARCDQACRSTIPARLAPAQERREVRKFRSWPHDAEAHSPERFAAKRESSAAARHSSRTAMSTAPWRVDAIRTIAAATSITPERVHKRRSTAAAFSSAMIGRAICVLQDSRVTLDWIYRHRASPRRRVVGK